MGINKNNLPDNPLLPAAQDEFDQKCNSCTRSAYHAEAFAAAELVLRGMKMQAIRSVVESEEMLKIKGFKRFEDFFESLGISRRTGFNMKKIAEAFSDEEVQLLHSIGFSRRGILRLSNLPPELLPEIGDTEDPETLRSRLEGALADLENQRKATERAKKQAEKESARADEANKKLYEYRHINEMNADPWVSLTRMELSKRWEAFIAEWRAFALSDKGVVDNDNAQEMLVEFYDRIFTDLDSIDLSRYEKCGLHYTRRKK